MSCKRVCCSTLLSVSVLWNKNWLAIGSWVKKEDSHIKSNWAIGAVFSYSIRTGSMPPWSVTTSPWTSTAVWLFDACKTCCPPIWTWTLPINIAVKRYCPARNTCNIPRHWPCHRGVLRTGCGVWWACSKNDALDSIRETTGEMNAFAGP